MTNDVFREQLKQKGLKITPQRVAIFEAVVKLRNHPTAEKIIEYIKNTKSSRIVKWRNTIGTISVNNQFNFIIIIAKIFIIEFAPYNMRGCKFWVKCSKHSK